MLRSLMFALCVFVSLPTMAGEAEEKELGFWFEARVPNHGPSRYTAWYQRDIWGSLGLYGTVEKESHGFRQFHLGPTWKPTEWLQLGAGIGRESQRGEFSSATRRALFFEAEPGDFNISGYFESGASGRWHKLTATYTVFERFGVGVMKETDFGFGPRVEYNFDAPGKPQLWGALLRGTALLNAGTEEEFTKRRTSVMLGINFSF